jgi:prepilin-type processing-associated H-X9-DG protein
MRTRILGSASIAGFAVAATLALAPAAHAEPIPSRHTGGVNASMGDGSVQFLRDSIDPAVLIGIGSRAGGEVVGDFSAMASRPDGSVRFITQALSASTWWQACTPDAGDTLGSDW